MWNINNLKRSWDGICRMGETVVQVDVEEESAHGTKAETNMKGFKHHHKNCSPEYRAFYNEYKAAYVKARRLKNLEAERERMREYMVKYRERKYQERKQQMSLTQK
jgi:hypothetical protein